MTLRFGLYVYAGKPLEVIFQAGKPASWLWFLGDLIPENLVVSCSLMGVQLVCGFGLV